MLIATPALIYLDPQHELHSKSFGVLSVDLEFADKLSTYSTAWKYCFSLLLFTLHTAISNLL